MTREAFDRQLIALEGATSVLGQQALAAVDQALSAFTREDLHLAQKVVDEDEGINRWERQILDDATTLLLLQAPVASDLRRILGVSRIAGYHEHIGDHARDIARATLRMAGAPPLDPPAELPVLGERVLTLLKDCLRSFETKDPELARSACRLDDEADRAYSALFTALLGRMAGNPTITVRATYTLFAARNLERIADYGVNVAQTVIYVTTGKTEELS